MPDSNAQPDLRPPARWISRLRRVSVIVLMLNALLLLVASFVSVSLDLTELALSECAAQRAAAGCRAHAQPTRARHAAVAVRRDGDVPPGHRLRRDTCACDAPLHAGPVFGRDGGLRAGPHGARICCHAGVPARAGECRRAHCSRDRPARPLLTGLGRARPAGHLAGAASLARHCGAVVCHHLGRLADRVPVEREAAVVFHQRGAAALCLPAGHAAVRLLLHLALPSHGGHHAEAQRQRAWQALSPLAHPAGARRDVQRRRVCHCLCARAAAAPSAPAAPHAQRSPRRPRRGAQPLSSCWRSTGPRQTRSSPCATSGRGRRSAPPRPALRSRRNPIDGP